MEFIYRKANFMDVNGIAKVHINSFLNFFLSSLGVSFLEVYYKGIIEHPKSILFVCTYDDEIIGFVSGTHKSKGFHKQVFKNNIIKFTIALVPFIFYKPKVIIRLIKNLSKNNNQTIESSSSELLSIAVTPKFNKSGIGSKLLYLFEKEVCVNAGHTIFLTTDYYDNNSTLNFYKKNGYLTHSDFITYPERRMYKLIKHINE